MTSPTRSKRRRIYISRSRKPSCGAMVGRCVALCVVLMFGVFVVVFDHVGEQTVNNNKQNSTTPNNLSWDKVTCGNSCRVSSPEEDFLKLTQDTLSHTNVPGIYQITNQEVFFSSAFLDKRGGKQSYLRIIGIEHRDYDPKLDCRFHKGASSVTIATAHAHYIYNQWPPNSFYEAVIYHCVAPAVLPVNEVDVCLMGTNNCTTIPFNIVNDSNNEDRKGLAVFVKAAWGSLNPGHLIEWIELNRFVGVDKIILYNSSISGKANEVIDMYREMGVIEITPFTLLQHLCDHAKKTFTLSKADDYSTLQQVSLLSLNDCIYRYNHRFQYLLNIDLDEVLVPTKEDSLPVVIQHIYQHVENVSGLIFKTAWHFKDFGADPSSLEENIPQYFNMLHYNRRSPPGMSQPKSVLKPDHVVSVNWHSVLENLRDSPWGLNVLIGDTSSAAYIHHYRGYCIDKFVEKSCKKRRKVAETDTIVSRYASRLATRGSLMAQLIGVT